MSNVVVQFHNKEQISDELLIFAVMARHDSK